MRLQVGGRLDDVLRADHPAHPPAGHGVCLGDPVDDDAAVGQLGHLRHDRREQRVAVDQVFVDFVSDDPQAVGVGPLTDRRDLVGRVDRAGRVRRRDEHQDLGPVGPLRLELFDGGQVAGGLVGQHRHRNAASQPDRFGVSRPVRSGQQHLVTGIEDGRERVVERLLAPIGDQDLACGDFVV